MANTWLRDTPRAQQTALTARPHPLHENSTTLAMWSYLKAQFGYQVPVQVFQKIALLPDDWLQRVLDAAPTPWLAAFDPQPTIDFWVQHRQQRCTEAMCLL